jgi:hypothetical protein
MHCVAGDRIGILVAATITGLLRLPMGLDLIAEYFAGFLFGWTVFQALFMKGLMGARIARRWSRLSCLNSSRWNGVMAGMAAVMVTWIDAGPDRQGAGGL